MAPRYGSTSFSSSPSFSSSGGSSIDFDFDDDWPPYSSSGNSTTSCEKDCKIIVGAVFGVPALIVLWFILCVLWLMFVNRVWHPAVKKWKGVRERLAKTRMKKCSKGGWFVILRKREGARADGQVKEVAADEGVKAGG